MPQPGHGRGTPHDIIDRGQGPMRMCTRSAPGRPHPLISIIDDGSQAQIQPGASQKLERGALGSPRGHLWNEQS